MKLEILKKIGLFLVDIHSQHENLLVKHENFQLELIDIFAKNQFSDFNKYIIKYHQLFKEYNDTKLDIEDSKF